MSRLSGAAASAVLAPETEKVFLHLIAIETSGGATLRFVDNTQNITSRGDVYTAAGFTIILPEQSAGAPSPCRLAIDNTDLSIFRTIKQAAGQTVTVSICVIMADTPDIYERGPLKYRLRNVKATKAVIEGEVYDFYLADRKFPKDTYAPDDFEGMFF
jgi:predicted RNA-binding protein with TRAM domain